MTAEEIVADALAEMPRISAPTRSRVEAIIDAALTQMARHHRRDIELLHGEIELLREERDRLRHQLAEVRVMLDHVRARTR